MKTFGIALLLFAGIVGLCILDSVFCTETGKQLKELHEKLPSVLNEQTDKILTQLEQYWEKRRFFLCLTLHKNLSDPYDQALFFLRNAYRENNLASYLSAKAQADFALTSLQSALGFSWDAFV